MNEDQFIENTLAEVVQLNAELIEAGVDTTFTEGSANEAIIEWNSEVGQSTLYVCLSQNHAYLVSERGSSFDMDVAQAKENIFNSYI